MGQRVNNRHKATRSKGLAPNSSLMSGTSTSKSSNTLLKLPILNATPAMSFRQLAFSPHLPDLGTTCHDLRLLLLILVEILIA